MTNKTYGIEGMHCGSCAKNIEHFLLGQKGINKASVNFELKNVSIEYDEHSVELKLLADGISSLGYNLVV